MENLCGEGASGEAEAVETAYGCLFCMTGKEEQVARNIRENCPGIHALTMRKMKYRTRGGQKSSEESLLLPSYVFFRAPIDADPFHTLPRLGVVRVLTTDNDEWRLQGGDRQFARWLFQYDGLLDFSKACREGSRIRIISGPLKDMEGRITRIDKRGCSGQVTVEFNGRTFPIWLGFELIDLL